ncbi:phytochrome C-like [Hibiscus syriacus]|uniref:Phytochrome C-like n=1 Tax=Hibiscus syriacus TaxID=106335 RepID=A0A6A3AEW6_HIBSY|nr:phytochrome C-like [Hibiscus syriacus]
MYLPAVFPVYHRMTAKKKMVQGENIVLGIQISMETTGLQSSFFEASLIAMLLIWHLVIVNLRGEGWDSLIAERMGNVGYAFNRAATVYPSFGSPVYTLRGPRTSAVHFGKCGLHQGQGNSNACIDNGSVNIQVEDIDKVANIRSERDVEVYENQQGYKAGFKGWGGWGDNRDHQLCLNFAQMYH